MTKEEKLARKQQRKAEKVGLASCFCGTPVPVP